MVPSDTLKHRHRISMILVALMAGFGIIAACSSGPETTGPQEDQFIGAPPENDDDALFRYALPAEAVPADPRGTVGTTEGDAAPLDEAEPTPQEEIIPPEELPDERQACFSCVRICPINDDGRIDCESGTEDLICGWGAHDDAEQARLTANAHCEASLEMARHMPNYSEIGGECPPATCR